MADCSLDDYIKQKGIGPNIKKRTAAGIKTDTVGTRIKILPPNGNKVFGKKPITAPASAKMVQRFDARQRLSKPIAKGGGNLPQKAGAASRLGNTTAANVRIIPRLGGAPVQSLIPGPESGRAVSDARQKILAKTKFADARQRILNKKLKKEGTAATVPSLFDVRQKIEAKRGTSVQPLFPYSVQPTPGMQDTQQLFQWGAPVAPLVSQQGVLNFGGNIIKTVKYPPPLAANPQPLMGNPVETKVPNPQILQNNAKLFITMKNDQRAATIVSTQQHYQQPVTTVRTRTPFGKVADQQPIQTLVSQPPVKVVNKPSVPVSTQVRPPIAAAAAAKRPEVELASPLQGFRIQVSNLHPNVSHEDITELFGAVGALKRTRLVKAGYAEVVYVNHEDAVAAVAKYHMRELDGLPMNLVLEESIRAQPTASVDLPQHQPLGLKKTAPTQVIDLDANILHKALFKTSSDLAPVKPVSFTVHM